MPGTPRATKKDAQYQAVPNGTAKCELCMNIRYAPKSPWCVKVEGKISPQGWCKWFNKKVT
jgi:hypothetical protein